jgi:hypothetical protein
MTFGGHVEILNLKSLLAQAIGSLNMLSSCSKDTPQFLTFPTINELTTWL